MIRTLDSYRHPRAAGAVVMMLGLAILSVPTLNALSLAQTHTKTVIAGERYAIPPGGQIWALGTNYRDLWAAPIEVEVLDLQNFAGGLRPVRRVGGEKALGLAMKGQDGRDYTFRSVDKDLTHVLPEMLHDSAFAEFAQDQLSANVPGVEVVVHPFAEAVGVLEPESRLVVMPDDPALGEYQKDFAGVLGIFLEYPQAVSDTNPGFRGATEIQGPDEFWELRQKGPENLADTRAFLRARLLDIFLGDWDRHSGQWRWARIPGMPLLQPMPVNRDQSLCDFEGLALDTARMTGTRMVLFEENYPELAWSIQNGWDLDRFLLTDIERSEWMEIAADMQSRLTDEVIETGLRRMPPEYYSLRGAELSSILQKRRDKLSEMADRYYRHMAPQVDIQCSNRSEIVEIERFEGGDIEVSVAEIETDEASADPYYRRRFKRDETDEVRIYLHGGNNRIVTRGVQGGKIKVRLIGGPGNDVVDDTQGGSVDFSDFQGNNSVLGDSGAKTHSKPYEDPGLKQPNENVPWVPSRDWGRDTRPLAVFGYHPDPGLILGAGVESTGYGFRKYPWADHHVLRGGFGFDVKEPFVDYKGDFRRRNASLHYVLETRFSGLDQLRYYGLGNETTNDRPDSVYMISNRQFTFFPGLAITRGSKGALVFGPIIKYSDTSGTEDDTVLNEEQPLGVGKFGQVGFQAEARYDSRKSPNIFAKGIDFKLNAAYYAEAWDARSDFGSVEGEFGAHIPLGDPLLLTFYVGGKNLWGDYPFFEAAYIGGHHTTLGYNWNRFAGDRSLYGILALRWAFARLDKWVPGELGVVVEGDVGRVWLEGEDSKRWHPSYAAGVFYAPFHRAAFFEAGIGKSSESTFFIFRAQMNFLQF